MGLRLRISAGVSAQGMVRGYGYGQAMVCCGGGVGWLTADGMFVGGYLNLSELIRTYQNLSEEIGWVRISSDVLR